MPGTECLPRLVYLLIAMICFYVVFIPILLSMYGLRYGSTSATTATSARAAPATTTAEKATSMATIKAHPQEQHQQHIINIGNNRNIGKSSTSNNNSGKSNINGNNKSPSARATPATYRQKQHHERQHQWQQQQATIHSFFRPNSLPSTCCCFIYFCQQAVAVAAE
mmetsp:Transcript_29849/g.63313  ORF Transcript_29849/g.63313 Transcript_29849/m.63313 type:complete len:166 (+) Transcript_29849:787-1284(+)